LFQQFIEKHDFDIICINEHWIGKVEIDILKIPGFSLMSYFARAKNQRGGTLILGKKHHKQFKRVGFKSREMYYEICGVSLKLGTNRVIFVSIYRPSNPKSDAKLDKFFDDLVKTLEKIHDQFGVDAKFLVAGDLNIDLLKNDSKANKLINIFKNFGLNLINSSPTRIAGNSKTLIDHLFTNFEVDNNSVKTESVIFSDHEAVTLSLPFATQKINSKFYKFCRSYSVEKSQQFCHLMEQHTWDNVFRLDKVNDKYSSFYSTFFQSFDASFPTRRVCFDSRKPFRFPASLKEEAERERLKMFSKYVREHPSDHDTRYLQNWRNYFQWKILQVKAQYNSGIIEKSSNKIKAAWKVVNTDLGNEERKVTSIPKLSVAGEIIENPRQVANLLNEKFIVQRADTEELPD
jgi:exonuclease III